MTVCVLLYIKTVSSINFIIAKSTSIYHISYTFCVVRTLIWLMKIHLSWWTQWSVYAIEKYSDIYLLPSFSYTKVVFWRDFVVVSVKLKKKYLQTTYVNIYYTLFKQINICKLYTCIHISSKQNAHASFCSHDWQLLKSRMYIFLTRTRWDGNHTFKKYLDLVISHIKISRKRFCKSFLYIILCLTCHRSWCIIFA